MRENAIRTPARVGVAHLGDQHEPVVGLEGLGQDGPHILGDMAESVIVLDEFLRRGRHRGYQSK